MNSNNSNNMVELSAGTRERMEEWQKSVNDFITTPEIAEIIRSIIKKCFGRDSITIMDANSRELDRLDEFIMSIFSDERGAILANIKRLLQYGSGHTFDVNKRALVEEIQRELLG